MRLLMIAPLVALAACVADVPAPDRPLDDCGASALQDRVGSPLSTFNVSTHKGPVRILGPGSIMTMDLAPHRLNIQHDQRGIITKVTCG